MKFLVTGGSGFIASRLVDQLSESGHSGVSFDLRPPERLAPCWVFVQGDVRDGPAVTQAASGCDAVFHLAAAHHDQGISPATYFAVNEHGTRSVCDAANTHGIGRICFFSSAAVYGAGPPPHHEAAPLAPLGPYGASKLQGEQVLWEWASGNPTRRVLIIRPTAIIGPGNFANFYTLCRQLDRAVFVEVGGGGNLKSLGYVDNLVAATLLLWTRGGTQSVEVFNYADKPDLTSAEIVGEVRLALGRSPRSLRIPYGLALLAALPFELGSLILRRDLGISRQRIRKLCRISSTFDTGKLQALGFAAPVSLREGIRQTVRWYRAEGRHLPIVRSIPPAELLRVSPSAV